jgi:serine/threonine-protein kinase
MIGQIIGHYRVLEKLGEGGMGVVYKAQDMKLKRQVVLKFIHPHLTADREATGRFEREAQAAAALNHPNIITVHEIGEVQDQIFIVMEYVQGGSLRDEMRRSSMSIGRAADIGRQISEGLSEAHQAGIVHRDVKPENILIDKSGRVKIADFGLARIKGITRLTKEASTLGTLKYMSPEQFQNKAADNRTDIWSLGVMLYEMLTGDLPFQGDYEAALMYAVLNEKPGSPSHHRPDVPTIFEDIILRCLEKDPGRRYQKTMDIAGELRRYKIGFQETHDATIQQPAGRLKKRRNIGKWIFAVMITALLVVLSVTYILERSKDRKNSDFSDIPRWKNSVAVLPFEDLSFQKDQDYFCDGMTDDIIMKLSRLKNLRVPSRTSVMPYKNQTLSIESIARELGVNMILEGSIQKEGDQIRVRVKLVDAETNSTVWSDYYDRKLSRVFAIQDEISLAIAGNLRMELVGDERDRLTKQYTDNTEAYSLYLKGRWFWNKWTADDIKKAMSYFRQAIAEDSSYALAYAGLAEAYNTLSFYGPVPPEEAYPKARALVLKALELDDELPEAHTVLAYIKTYHDWDWEGGEKGFRTAIQLDPNSITAHHLYSYFLVQVGRFDEALSEIKIALSIDPVNLITNRTLGDMYYHSRQYDRAIPHFQKTIEMDSTFTFAHYYLGLVYREKGMYAEALRELRKEAGFGSGAGILSKVMIGTVYAKMGKNNQANAILNELLDFSVREYVPETVISMLYFALGEKDEGFAYLEKAYERRDIWLTQILAYHEFDSIRSDERYLSLLERMGLDGRKDR